MKKALKDLIENAPVKRSGRFLELMFVSNGKYRGFFGPNGYNKMLVLGKGTDDSWYRILLETEECDLFYVCSNKNPEKYTPAFNLDIPEEYGVPRIWFSRYYFKINYTVPLSTLDAELEEMS